MLFKTENGGREMSEVLDITAEQIRCKWENMRLRGLLYAKDAEIARLREAIEDAADLSYRLSQKMEAYLECL
jgi:hypothetical protein